MSCIVAPIATNASPFVAISERDVANSERYGSAMLHQWLRKALDHSNIGQADLARRMTEILNRSIDRAAVNKMLKGPVPGGRKIAGDEVLAISQITRFPPPRAPIEDDNTVPVVGYVGAGAAMNLFGLAQGELGRVKAPDGSTAHTVAVEIQGTSLGELFDRWLVYYDLVHNPPTGDLIGRLCVVGLADGRVLIKKLMGGQIAGHWTLLSNTEPPIYDVVVEWAARVKQMSPR